MLPCRYFHVTITVPEELRDVLRANQRDGYVGPPPGTTGQEKTELFVR